MLAALRPRGPPPNHAKLSLPRRANSSSTHDTAARTYTREYAALGLMTAGVLGWYFYPNTAQGGATSPSSSSHSHAVESVTGPTINLKRTYGGKEEIKSVISELTAALREGSVSTNAEELEAHGYSTNSYHGGKSVVA